jgi:hypothetical protein
MHKKYKLQNLQTGVLQHWLGGKFLWYTAINQHHNPYEAMRPRVHNIELSGTINDLVCIVYVKVYTQNKRRSLAWSCTKKKSFMQIKTNALFWFRGPYFKPSPLKCWTINRTISWSVWDMGFRDEDFTWKSPLANEEQEPFCWDDVAMLDSPLCWGQPLELACMVVAETRCFLRGGGEVPPSSDSDDDASIAQLHSVGKTLQ